MMKSKFTDAQILSILKQADSGTSVANICREHQISSSTILQMARQIWWHGPTHDGQAQRVRD